MPARRHPISAAVYSHVDRTPGTVLLEGGHGKSENNEESWTRLFTAPLRICVVHKPDEVPALFTEIEQAVAAGLSAAGFFSYECGMAFEPKAAMRSPRPGLPLAWFGIYRQSDIFDPESAEFIDEGGSREQGIGPESDAPGSLFPSPSSLVPPFFSLPEPAYATRIAAIHDYIRAGDVYQLNFTAPFSVHAPGAAADLYATLRARQPAEYGAFVHWQQDRRILSFSPELFFRIDRDGDTRRITARPMKGTARRGRTTAEDRSIAEWLRSDAKNRSENLMIVDLIRNDLGRVARFGTVRAEQLFNVERLPTLWQMTSTVTAELRPDAGFEQIFRALFPCGSITGAPKVRAMQLIGELEDGPRGVYTGAIGFFSPRQTVFNVAIRTLELEGDRGTMGVGSGIVIDSDAAAEYRECLLKAKFLTAPAFRTTTPWITQQPDEFFLIETMLWNGSYPLLELHLDRLCDSAEYFGWACDRMAIKAALEERARQFNDTASRRVRLLLTDADGSFQISDSILESASPDEIGRVRISVHRTDPGDPTLYHKTTQRVLYSIEYASTLGNGYADVLFFNNRGELTEGAISNVFIEKAGRWFTPPLECGLLAGVYRRHLLATRADIQEKILHEDDLRTADAIYIANAVRGLRKVTLD